MAEIAIRLVIQKLTDAFIEEVGFLSEVPAKIEWIKTEFLRMRCFLADADAKGMSGDERAKNWVKEIRDVAYQAEDIVDVIRFKIEMRRRETSSGCMIVGSAARYVSIPKGLLASHEIGARIDNIKHKIEDIANSRDRYGIKNLGEGADHDAVNESNALVELHRRGEETDVVGFEKDKQKLLNLLLDADSRRLSAVTIVGMGGLGKTTLARKVYRSPEISKYFGATAFVSVSQTLKSVFLVKDIIKQVMIVTTETPRKRSKGRQRKDGRNKNVNHGNEITKDELDSMSEEDAKEILRKFLCKRRYLIVLDDIWETNDWYQLKDTFPDMHNGSRLLITTRYLNIAEHADQIPPHELQKLSDEESWELFQKKAFPVERCCPKHLEEFGRLLSRRCDGLPLALVVLGGLFSRMPHTYIAWSEVGNRINWESRRDASVCLRLCSKLQSSSSPKLEIVLSLHRSFSRRSGDQCVSIDKTVGGRSINTTIAQPDTRRNSKRLLERARSKIHGASGGEEHGLWKY